jgi:hypothetical protein
VLERQKRRARALSAQIDGLLAGQALSEKSEDGRLPDARPSIELAVAQRLHEMVALFPPVPADLERRVQESVRSRPVRRRLKFGWRLAPAALSALVTALVFLVVLFVVPGLSGGQRSWANFVELFLGQTRIVMTPTLRASATPALQGDGTVRLTPAAGDAQDGLGAPQRELLHDLVAAELLIGRAPSVPKDLPQGYDLLEIAAVSYPDLPPWISQPFYVELCYGTGHGSAASDLRLRQYRLLFRELGGISGVQVASDAVKDMEQVDIKGATGMLLTFDAQGDSAPGAIQPTYTVLWERDGLLLELETDTLSQERLLQVARSVR